ncbi:MAG: ATP-binding protein [Prolixibacteraceae bacterium]|nr:ATP-binding protein [Prolixibacteraceae bacterium]
MYLFRPEYEVEISHSMAANPITAILGPRQCGKTTIARKLAADNPSVFFDLEDPDDFELLKSSAKQLLNQQTGLIVIDEVQRLPELFPLLRVMADQQNADRKFLLLGSASPELMRNSSETLAGRIGFVDLTGFNLDEVGTDNLSPLWLRGGFPRSYLADDDPQSYQWRQDFIRTFLERDLNLLGFNLPAQTMRRFWIMLAHYHGQIWKASEFARSLGVSEPTVKSWLDILSGAYMVRQVQPWYENLGKRQVKAPKILIRDSGLLHALLSLPDHEIQTNPKLGASWEGFIIEQIINRLKSRDYYYWRTHAGLELDLMVLKNGKRLGFEIKYSETPKVTRSMHQIIDDLKLDQFYIVYQGKHQLELEEKVQLLPISALWSASF